ncbi:MAG: 50S ribosomal protein L25/general stress protein Ctc [Chelatococcus sp.]|jgi:large subunit ribosomal protein L25|uniref:50S ribosomal protein L25/general stress protein Ctc n=1 Tax=unclassified Chelatococcus TaxID=2638111 RepID=UPI001BCE774B|nr:MULTISPECIES: 50S ribosomal protein L25/general stress protein Ctc [unclassified Chelatococcus]CAH1664904.1 50S ribosomal protein L25 [Hyphomicrobiales bacterium]MBS7737649.1 50S ribosomal protein L25/general stress protein Ctc [Chelatococcus sp. HY11]MBX3540835.1 50S ribosomal protein L25/general stress protein Ctc [Chelatococcus sp.]MBX3544217.1 50S ribosomal protein L25/general stress protein Ctc [Chelatococcus sp.]MCO5079461.1 50S ribosomal protein L25/general stress protein Ctc [Chelat
MTSVKQIKAVARERVGKGAARAVRREGQVPAVIYGSGQPAVSIALDYNETKRLIFAGHFLTTLFEIEVGGDKTRVIPRDYQLDPVKDTPLHVDFLRVAKDATISVEVPVHFVNQEASPGLKAGGVLNVVHHTIELIVPADAIPDAVEIDVTGLEIGTSIHLEDVKLPAGAKAATNEKDFTVATIAAPAKLEVAADAAAEPTAE